MAQSRKRTVLHVAMVAVVLLLLACGGESEDEVGDLRPSSDQPTLPAEASEGSAEDNAGLDADGDGFMTERELEQAVQLAFEDYEWPADYTPTVRAILGPSNDQTAEGLYQIGMEHTLIGSWHDCAWYMAWLDAFQSGDNARQAEALRIMTEVLPNSPTLDPSGVEVLSRTAEQAALGDPSEVIRAIEGMRCNDLPFRDATEGGGATTQDHARSTTVWSVPR